MNVRSYSKCCAGEIAREVVLYGESSCWTGDYDDLKRIQEVLSKFNIGYVDDMYGKWEYCTDLTENPHRQIDE